MSPSHRTSPSYQDGRRRDGRGSWARSTKSHGGGERTSTDPWPRTVCHEGRVDRRGLTCSRRGPRQRPPTDALFFGSREIPPPRQRVSIRKGAQEAAGTGGGASSGGKECREVGPRMVTRGVAEGSERGAPGSCVRRRKGWEEPQL